MPKHVDAGVMLSLLTLMEIHIRQAREGLCISGRMKLEQAASRGKLHLATPDAMQKLDAAMANARTNGAGLAIVDQAEPGKMPADEEIAMQANADLRRLRDLSNELFSLVA